MVLRRAMLSIHSVSGRSQKDYIMPSKNSIVFESAVRVTIAFFQAGVVPLLRPTLLARPLQFMVLTLATLTPKSSSTALAISILLASLATLKVYLFSCSPPMLFSEMMGLITISCAVFMRTPPQSLQPHPLQQRTCRS